MWRMRFAGTPAILEQTLRVCVDAAFVLDRILSPPRAKANPNSFLDGAIILMHEGKQGTAEAVPDLVKSLRDRGFSLVTVDEILKP